MHNACIFKLEPGYSGPLFHYLENRGTYTTFAGGTIAHCRYLDIYISRKIMLCVAKMFFKPVWEGKMLGVTKIGIFCPLFCVGMLGKSTNYSTGTRPLCSTF